MNGDHEHPLYKWMKNEKKQLLMSRIKWNFEKVPPSFVDRLIDLQRDTPKFLIDKNGNVHERFASTTTPQSLEGVVEKLLKE